MPIEQQIEYLKTLLESNNISILEEYLPQMFSQNIDSQKRIIDLFLEYTSSAIWSSGELRNILLNNRELYEYSENKLAEMIQQGVSILPLTVFKDSTTVLKATLNAGIYSPVLNMFSSAAYEGVDIELVANLICSDKIEFIPQGLQSNAKLLNILLNNNIYKYIDDFGSEGSLLDWSFSGDFVTPFTDDNVSLIISAYKRGKIESFPTGMSDNPVALRLTLDSGQYDSLLWFGPSAFNEENMAKLKELLKNNKINYIPVYLRNSNELLKFVIRECSKDLIREFSIEAFTIAEVEQIIVFLKNGLLQDIPECFCDSSDNNLQPTIVEMLLQNNLSKHITYFRESAFTESTLSLFYQKLREGKIDKIPLFLNGKSEVLEAIINSPKKSLLDQLKISAFTTESVNKFIQRADNIEDFMYLRMANAEEVLNNEETLNLLSKKFNDPSLKEKITSLLSKNSKIFESLNLGLLSSPFSVLGLDFIERISRFESIQKPLLRLSKSRPACIRLFARIVDVLNNSTLDITELIEKICINGLESNAYDSLLSDISDVDTLSEEDIWMFGYVLSKMENPFNIQSLNDLRNLKEKRTSAFNRANNSNELKQMGILKSNILEKRYGVNIREANFILSRYLPKTVKLDDLEKSGVDKAIIDALSLMKKVNECEDISILKEMLNNVPDIIDIDISLLLFAEERIRAAYAKMYNKTLYKPRAEDLSRNIKLSNVEYNGNKIEVYELNDDFAMQIHALGAYSDYETPNNFKDAWDIPEIVMHGLCTSYIRNDEIAVARSEHPILGFASYESAGMLLQGNYDLNSSNFNMCNSISGCNAGAFFPPSMLPDMTRHNHNETVLERRLLKGDGQFKRQPDYIVYITDSLENDELNSSLWEETKQAAQDFGVPIVLIDREKFLTREKNKMASKFDKFEKTKDPTMFSELFTTYMNNVVGNRYSNIKSSININNADKLFDYCIYTIVKLINKKEFDQASSLIVGLSSLLERESASFSVAKLASEKDRPKYLNKKSIVDYLLQCAKEPISYKQAEDIYQTEMAELKEITVSLSQSASQETEGWHL